MDDRGVDVQVLSLTTPGTQSLAPRQAAAPARVRNDHAADTLRNAIEVLGIDRILFSVDYPYQPAPDGAARRFLTEAPLSDADRNKVAHLNWERLTGRP